MASRSLGVWGIGVALGAVACLGLAVGCEDERRHYDHDDDDDDAGYGGGSMTTQTSSTTTSWTTTSSPPPDAGDGCMTVCTDLYGCTQVPGLCPGLAGTSLSDWLYGTGSVSCLADCEGSPALAILVNPADCPGTVDTLSMASATFAALCSGSEADAGQAP